MTDDVSSSDFELIVEPDQEQLERSRKRYDGHYDLSSTLGGLEGGYGAAGAPQVHHELVQEELDRYLFPVNMPPRDYQRNMIRKALVRNLIVALPTGLGKTFIASVVMWNWYRWTKSAKVIFLAPTRPLVTQQVTNFLEITGISVHDTAVFIQQVVKKPERELLWKSRRVFFATPQTVENDLRNGLFDASSVVCLVIDEAHRATGNYSYVNLVQQIKQTNPYFRVLALTATPSGKFEGVQQVIDNLCISATEIRSEQSLDVKQYTHAKKLNKIIVQPDANMNKIKSLLQKLMAPLLEDFCTRKIISTVDPMHVHSFAFQENVRTFMRSQGKAGYFLKAKADVLTPLLYAIGLLQTDGIFQFYERVEAIRQKFISTAKPGKNLAALCKAPEFNTIIQACKQLIYLEDGQTRNPEFLSHPKMERLSSILNDFNLRTSGNSRCIIFTNYRDTAQEIQWMLTQRAPFIVSSLFVGQQSSSKGVKGMTQKEQQALLEKFKMGDVNTLIATSVAEEGLDIAQVDLIICYDQSSSPIRSIQRMGRTGRARDGTVYILMNSKEAKKLEHALSGHKWLEHRINLNEGSSTLTLNYVPSPRILPPNTTQRYVEVTVEPPAENKHAIEHEDLLSAMRPSKRDGYLGRPRKRARTETAAADPKQTKLQWASALPQTTNGPDSDCSTSDLELDEDMIASFREQHGVPDPASLV